VVGIGECPGTDVSLWRERWPPRIGPALAGLGDLDPSSRRASAHLTASLGSAREVNFVGLSAPLAVDVELSSSGGMYVGGVDL
jgi:hypothetical protein